MTPDCEAHGCDTPATERIDSDWYCREHYVAATRAAPTGMYAPVSTSEEWAAIRKRQIDEDYADGMAMAPEVATFWARVRDEDIAGVVRGRAMIDDPPIGIALTTVTPEEWSALRDRVQAAMHEATNVHELPILRLLPDGTTAPIDTESRPITDEPESADTC